MARIRTIKPEFPQSESMGRVSRDARLCFIMLWTIADDSGRLRGNSRMLASLLFPYDNDAPNMIDAWLNELQDEGAIIRYQVENHNYVQVCNWLNHQKIDKPTTSKIPEFDESSRILANPRESSSLDQGSRIKDQGSSILSESGDSDESDCSDDVQQIRSRFDDFWQKYPKKVGKKPARDLWKRKRLDAKADEIVKDIGERLASDRRWLSGYIPDPKTYLSQERWTDEIDRSSPTVGHPTTSADPELERHRAITRQLDPTRTQSAPTLPPKPKLSPEEIARRRLEAQQATRGQP